MSEYEYGDFTYSLPSADIIISTNDILSYNYNDIVATSLFPAQLDKSQKPKGEKTFNFVNMENNCSTLVNEEQKFQGAKTKNLDHNTTKSNDYNYINNDYNMLKEELNNLRLNLTKFCTDLLLNELKIELNYLVEKIKDDLDINIKAKISQLLYEQSILNAKMAAVECKLLNYSINLDMNDTKATFLHQEDKNEKINTEEVYFSKLSFFFECGVNVFIVKNGFLILIYYGKKRQTSTEVLDISCTPCMPSIWFKWEIEKITHRFTDFLPILK